MIIQELSKNDFVSAFKDSSRADNFTFTSEALEALFDFFDELSDDTGEAMTLDIVAICCDFTEYESIEAVAADYPDIESFDDLQDHTMAIEFDGGIVFQSF